MAYQHKSLAEGRWQTFSIAEQLGNIGSEVGRALSWRRRGNKKQSEKAFWRGIELLDLTIASQKGHRRKEVARAKEVVADYFFGGNVYGSKPQSLENYFTQFALLARRNK